MVLAGAAFEQGSGEIFLIDVKCNGTEISLDKCQSGNARNCIHREDAGVRCSGKIVIHFLLY